MPMDRFWRTVADSVFPWEKDALDFLRRRLPDDERFHVWSNFEILTQDGRIYEVDLLAVTPAGIFLVEIKSWPGRIAGDAGTWTWTHDGQTRGRDNPRIQANHKARVLKSLLLSQRALRKVRDFYVEALVFLAAEDVRVDLDERAGAGVWLRDREATATRPGRPGIVDALTRWPGRPRVDRPKAAALARAMEELGVRPSRRAGRFGDYQLRELLYETADYQEWRVEKESFAGIRRRARLYPVALADGPESRERRVRAARREFSFLTDLTHPGILAPVEYLEDERGPVLFFDHHGDSLRLDHYLRQEHERLDVDRRLNLLRQLFEAVAFAHHRGLVHRALSPRTIEVERPGSPTPRVRVGDWHQGRRRSTDRLTATDRLSATDHVGAGLDEPSQLYLAPETRAQATVDERDEPKLDVFSLGAVAYHVFSGTPPAADLVELERKLHDGPGLQLSTVVDGAVDALQDMIAEATHPDVERRLGSVADLLSYLELVEDQLTEPDASAFADPRVAKAGDRLAGGFDVLKVLGSGAVARVFLVRRGAETAVLKVALEREHNARLDDEHDVLEKLRHELVVAPRARVDVDGRAGILMDEAGETTLERELRGHGALDPAELRRLGDELLRVVDHLEEKGIAHRDLKPANLGLRGESGGRRHLVVFDFSLSRIPAERVLAGTVGYLDPFLRRPGRGRWDVHAERFAAAVTLYEMATGTRPVWGDGRSDPALVDDAAPRVEPEHFPALPAGGADALARFFRRALAPALADRFDTCEEMIEAWRKVFTAPAVVTAPAEAPKEEAGEAEAEAVKDDGATRQPPATRPPIEPAPDVEPATWSVDRLFDDLLPKTRRDSRQAEVLERLLGLAADDGRPESTGSRSEARTPTPTPPFEKGGLGGISAAKPRIGRPSLPYAEPPLDSEATARTPTPTPPFDRVALGGSPTPPFEKGGLGGISPWPSQSDVAADLGVTRARVGQVTATARGRWLRQPALTELRADLADVIARHGGVTTVDELADAVLVRRGSTRRSHERRRRAAAVVRAALEAEAARDAPRFAAYRRSQGTFAALAGDDDLGARLATWAAHLGQRADQLAGEEPPPSAARAREALAALAPPGGPPDPERLLRLAAAASRHAALSPRQELYPRGLPAARAVSLARGALLGARRLDVDGVHRRVLGRFPEAAPLPRRPELDALLRDAGTGLVWWPGPAGGDDDGFYGPESLPSLSSETAHGPADEDAAAAAARFERLLRRSARDRGFLVLTVTPRLAERAASALAHNLERHGLRRLSLERLLIEAMLRVAEREGADWDVILAADAAPRSSDDWALLVDLVRHHALPEVETTLESSAGTVLLTHPGLLARYDALAFLERLRERCGRGLGAWVLVPTGDPTARPVLDGRALPVLGPNDWVAVPEAWVESRS